MTGIVGGLGAAICWACSALCATAASRSLGAASTLAWIMMLGLAILLAPLALFASIHELSARVVVLLVVSGTSNVLGLALEYQAFKRGKVGVVTAIASTEGMVATLIAIVDGAGLSVAVFLVLWLITAGVAFTALAPDTDTAGAGTHPLDTRRAAMLAIPVPIMFGISLFATGKLGPHVSVLWAVLPGRLVGAAAIWLPLLVRRELRINRRVLPLVGVAAAAEVVGFASYAWGSHRQIAIPAVLASEYAALAAAGAFMVFGERLGRRQLGGLGIVALGVALLGALTS